MRFVNGFDRFSLTTDMFDYSIRPDFETKLRLFAEHGIKHIHWCDDWNSPIFYDGQRFRLYQQLIESYGLRCIDVHGASTPIINIDSTDSQIFTKYVQLLRNRIEFCSAMGGDVVVIHPPNVEGYKGNAMRKIERSMRAFEGVKALCYDLGISVAVENCAQSDTCCLEYYFDKYPPEFVGFCLDSGHGHINKNLDLLFQFHSRLKALHLSDNMGKTDDHQPPFSGTINWWRVLNWIESTRYSKPLNFEIIYRSKLFEGCVNRFLKHTTHSTRKARSRIFKSHMNRFLEHTTLSIRKVMSLCC